MRKKRRIVIYLFVLALLAGMSVIWILGRKAENPEQNNTETVSGNMEVHFLDAGQGDSILVRSENENLLIDAGTNEDEEMVVSYLKEQG